MSAEIDLTSALHDEEIARANMPVILHEGRYRLYQKPDGGLHLAYKRDDMDDLQHMEIPGALFNLARMAGEGQLTPAQMLREMMKMRNDHLCSAWP